MSITVAARYDGHSLVPERPLDLRVGQRVTVEVEEASENDDATERLWRELQLDPELRHQIEYSGGLLNVRDSRITVRLILELAGAGWEPVAIHERLPTANLPTIERLVAMTGCPSEALRNYLQSQRDDDAVCFDEAHRGPALEELRARTNQPANENRQVPLTPEYRFIP